MKLLRVGLLIAGIASILFAAGCGGGQAVPTPVAAVKAVTPTDTPAPTPAAVAPDEKVEDPMQKSTVLQTIAAKRKAGTDTPAPTPAAVAPTSDSIVQSTGTIAAVDLVEEFKNNAVAATQKYSGLDLVIEGEVTAIDYDFLGNPYVAVGSGGLFEINTVWCMVSDVSDVAGLSVGDKATVEGTFSEWDGMDVILKPCAP